MTEPVRFQILTLPGRPWAEYRAQVLHVEELGFDTAAVPDHFCDWANPPAPWLECWTLTAALAVETTSIRLATNVSQIPLRNPGVLAHQASCSDRSQSRLGRSLLGCACDIASTASRCLRTLCKLNPSREATSRMECPRRNNSSATARRDGAHALRWATTYAVRGSTKRFTMCLSLLRTSLGL